MPRELALDSRDEITSPFSSAPLTDTTRKPLSPKKTSSGGGDARLLVSSLRSKREDLIKRFEKANLTNHKVAPTSLNEDAENYSAVKKRSSLDSAIAAAPSLPSTKPADNTRRQSWCTPKQSFTKENSKSFDRQSSITEQSLKPVSEALATFEKKNGKSTPRPPPGKDTSWIRTPENRDSLNAKSEASRPCPTVETSQRSSLRKPQASEIVATPDRTSKKLVGSNAAWMKQQGSDKKSKGSDQKEQTTVPARKSLDAAWIRNGTGKTLVLPKQGGARSMSWIKQQNAATTPIKKTPNADRVKTKETTESVDSGNRTESSNSDESSPLHTPAERAFPSTEKIDSYQRMSTTGRCVVSPQSNTGFATSLSPTKDVGGKRKLQPELAWAAKKKPEGSPNLVPIYRGSFSAVPSQAFYHEKGKSATLAASWVRPGNRSKATSKPDKETNCGENEESPDKPSWSSKNNLTLTDDVDNNNHSDEIESELISSLKRKCVEDPTRLKKWGFGQQRSQIRDSGGLRRKSTGDVSWIRANVSPTARKAPWVQALERVDRSSPASPSFQMKRTSLVSSPTLQAKKREHDRSHRRRNSQPSTGRLFFNAVAGPLPPSPPFVATSTNTVNESISTDKNEDKVARDTRESPESRSSESSERDEPQLKPFNDKVSLFEPRKQLSDTFNPNDGVKAAKMYWESPKRLGGKKQLSAFTKVAAEKPTKVVAEKKTNISSLINAMEKFSMGEEFEVVGDIDDEIEAEEAAEVLPADEEVVVGMHPDDDTWVSRSSGENSDPEFIEYGDANFMITTTDRSEEGQEHCEPTDIRMNACEETSEGSTYKIDNYHKDFNESIPIQSPWIHPNDTYAAGYGIDRSAMTIVSVVQSPSKQGCDSAVDEEQAALKRQDQSSSSSAKSKRGKSRDKSLTTRRTHHQVACGSLLSATKKPPARSKSAHCPGQTTADPIFQVNDDDEQKIMQNIIKILSKKGEDEFCITNGYEMENKPSKSMFKKLKKGLGKSRAKDDIDLASGYFPTDEETLELICTDNRTTMSSITRSVNSNPGDSSQKSGDSKPMPLSVLNGFFKAARKLQKSAKRKKSRRRGRSMNSSKPPLERHSTTKAYNKQTQSMEATAEEEEFDASADSLEEVQLWPSVPQQQPQQQPIGPSVMIPGVSALTEDRKFGAYGGLASSRSKALNESITPAIQSLASW
ncbi:expressed unknown protein [Seminavis robusta]|uniref:Uncharacterized protein n=1 Tax=Seminavis robusta TaxID=568900 RepID=A0A9N8H602_9STRA|nr:expressed unknown protein [Seminavis robusta]|eukprot:Sro157_g071060.1 n/a (1194) ;mRNA; f:17793-21374